PYASEDKGIKNAVCLLEREEKKKGGADPGRCQDHPYISYSILSVDHLHLPPPSRPLIFLVFTLFHISLSLDGGKQKAERIDVPYTRV
ncbi:hypothetical protein L249_5925, partial [Ophiocordyceps polyrhachis-furcata BCC 54312]